MPSSLACFPFFFLAMMLTYTMFSYSELPNTPQSLRKYNNQSHQHAFHNSLCHQLNCCRCMVISSHITLESETRENINNTESNRWDVHGNICAVTRCYNHYSWIRRTINWADRRFHLALVHSSRALSKNSFHGIIVLPATSGHRFLSCPFPFMSSMLKRNHTEWRCGTVR